MRFGFFTFLLLLIFLTSCSGDKPAEDKSVKDSVVAVVIPQDTFYGGKNLLYCLDTTKAAFETLFNKTKTDTSELKNLEVNKNVVARHGDTLIFHLANGKTKKLVSTYYVEGMDSFYDYKYIGKLASVDYHVVFVSMYEAFSYLAINAKTGYESTLWGMPVVCPDNKFIVASCFDLQAGFVYNGIQMFEVGADSLKLEWARELTKWGADNITWLNDHTLVAEKMSLDSTQNVVNSYVTIRCATK